MLKVDSSEVYKFAEMTSYQEGSIVSKEIIQKETGTISVFAFDKGQALSEHVAPFDAMVYIMDGKAEVIIDGKSFEVSKGEMIILPVNVVHALKAVERFKMCLIMIR